MKDNTPVGLTAAQWETLTRDFAPGSSTANDYRKVLNLLNSGSSLNILTLTREQAEAWFSHLDERVEKGELTANTAHRYKATLRSIGARIEERHIVEGYTNPFKGLVKHESRNRAVYTMDSFISAEDIGKIRQAIPSFDRESRIILAFIMNLGLTPYQISTLKVSDFHRLDHLVTVKITSEFLEHTDKPWQESDLYLQKLPIRYVRASKANITWNYTGTYRFNEAASASLKAMTPTLGSNKDTRLFFHTPRHMPCSYRAVHHLIVNLCHEAGLEKEITPMQLAMYGNMCSALQMRGIEIPDVTPIGLWQDRLPLPIELQVSAVEKQLGPDALKQAVGIR